MIRYLSLFSGIGAFEKALDNLGIPYELLAYCEVDKYASKAYSLLHHVPESMNLGDITKVDEKTLPTDIDLLTYGFPCQDISIAGNKRGFVNEDGTKTRSGLFFDALRIIEHCKPKVAIAENVKNLTSKSMVSPKRRYTRWQETPSWLQFWNTCSSRFTHQVLRALILSRRNLWIY